MDVVVEFQNFSFRYPKLEYDIIQNANFTIKRGDCVLIFGPSGGGKSTLCYSLASLIPWSINGFFKGTVKILGHKSTEITPKMLAGSVGLVMQNPDNQFVNLTVSDELIFAAENLKVPEQKIRERLEKTVDLLDLQPLLNRNVLQLSGGEKQRVILGSVLMMKPEILILDEPLAFLDAHGRLELLHHISKVKTKFHDEMTIFIAEHRINEVLALTNKFILVDHGKAELFTDINKVQEWYLSEISELNKWKLNLDKDYTHEIQKPFSYEVTIEKFSFKPQKPYVEDISEEVMKKALISFKDVSFAYVQDMGKYNRQIKKIFENLSFAILPGEIIGVVGPNGSGKTTLLYLIAGILKPNEGNIYFKGEDLEEIPYSRYARNIGLIFQNPESQLLKNTIKKELEFGPKNFRLANSLSEEEIEESISLVFSSEERALRGKFGNEPIADSNPFNLSWGQKRRVNLASLYTYSPVIYLLDEPFTGQDIRMRKEIMKTFLTILGTDKAGVISTHDEELLSLCSRVFLLENNQLKVFMKKIGEDFQEASLWSE